MAKRSVTADRVAGEAVDADARPVHRGSKRVSPDIARQARAHTKAALEAFVAVMQDSSAPAAARVAAASQILTWGYGKAGTTDAETEPRTVRLAWEC